MSADPGLTTASAQDAASVTPASSDRPSPAEPPLSTIPAAPAPESPSTPASPAADPEQPQPSSETASPEVTPPPGPSWLSLAAETERLRLTLPADGQGDWAGVWQQLQVQLQGGRRFWQAQTGVEIRAGDRLLDQRQLQQLAQLLAEANLQLQRVHTCRRQTAIAAATLGYAVEQSSIVVPLQTLAPNPPLAPPLYLETTVRSGQEIRHAGSVVIIGDLNPGGEVVADGDILIWGRLRGFAHAGARGNTQCRIMALQMEATLLRIADQVARTPEPPNPPYPEVAYITTAGIRLSKAAEFGKIFPTPA
uniref:Probable septum site-determining protein MinC n=1 Tax=Cyanothece sp. (strain PCC 7425 / ATCC 29141) TaxID=395961 RepID=B8HMM3_CYAP4